MQLLSLRFAYAHSTVCTFQYGYCCIISSITVGTIDYTVQSSANNSIGITNFLGEVNNRSDVFLYLEKYRPEASSAALNFTIETIANGDNTQTHENSTALKAGKDLEGDLDAETILGMTWPTPLIAYNTGGHPPYLQDKLTVNDTNEPYLEWLQYILAQETIPSVISISYGDDEQTVPYSYATAVCNAFAQLGARGVSVLVASGDNGVGPAADCFTNDGKNTTTFLPIFPGGCVSVHHILIPLGFQLRILQ
jgi:tripeptidyl-peptidase-1